MAVRKVLVPLEISEISDEILPVVTNLFEPGSIQLTLLAVAQPAESAITTDPYATAALPPSVYTTMVNTAEWERYRAGLREQLQQKAERLREAGYQVSIELLTGDTVREIVNYAEQGDFDLLAMATYGRKGLSRLVFGSVAEAVLRSVTVPMLLVRHQPKVSETPVAEKLQPAQPKASTFTIVAVTDGTEHTQRAVVLAGHLAEAMQAQLKVLVSVRGRAGSAHAQKVMGEVHQLLQGLKIRPELVPLVGPTDEVVGRYLDEHAADMLVLAAFKDRGAGGTADIGVTAQRLVQYASMPVIVVKGPQPQIRRVLACINLDDAPVLDSAIQVSKALKADLQLLHVLPPTDRRQVEPAPRSLDIALAQDEPRSLFLQDAISLLEREGYSRDALQVWQGDPLKTILHVAQKGQVDLVVVGNQSFGGFFPASVANSVVRFAPKSVMVVRIRPS